MTTATIAARRARPARGRFYPVTTEVVFVFLTLGWAVMLFISAMSAGNVVFRPPVPAAPPATSVATPAAAPTRVLANPLSPAGGAGAARPDAGPTSLPTAP